MTVHRNKCVVLLIQQFATDGGCGGVDEATEGTWELRIFLGRNELGKVRHRYVTYVGNRTAAKRELSRLSLEVEEKPEERVIAPSAWGQLWFKGWTTPY